MCNSSCFFHLRLGAKILPPVEKAVAWRMNSGTICRRAMPQKASAEYGALPAGKDVSDGLLGFRVASHTLLRPSGTGRVEGQGDQCSECRLARLDILFTK